MSLRASSLSLVSPFLIVSLRSWPFLGSSSGFLPSSCFLAALVHSLKMVPGLFIVVVLDGLKRLVRIGFTSERNRSRVEGDRRTEEHRAPAVPGLGPSCRMVGRLGPRPARSQPPFRARIP